MRTILVTASLALCAVGCSIAAPPEVPVAPPRASAQPALEAMERSATVFGDLPNESYQIVPDPPESLAFGRATVRREDGREFAARIVPLGSASHARRSVAQPGIDGSVALRSLFDDDMLPLLRKGERIEYAMLGAIPGFDESGPRKGASDVVPRSR